MSAQTDMNEQRHQDEGDQVEMRALRESILDFLETPPARLSPRTQATLISAVGLLAGDEAHVASSWGEA